ncbi:MAG: Eco57I restriction-modification methylase domain-containing protein [Candidatus Heimdallarchaeaceae archaeon]
MISDIDLKVSFVETPKEIAELMIKLIDKGKNANVLDTGCGKGVFLDRLKCASFYKITGIELNKELAKYCEKKHPDIKIFNCDFLSWSTGERYDVVIGNPPYSHYNSLPKEIQKKVFHITKTKETDIYYAFIIKSIDILKEGGELIYIVPYGFFYATHAKIVREHIINNGYLECVIDLDEVKLFVGENPETVIFKFKKNKKGSIQKTQIIRLKTRKATPEELKEKALEAILSKRSNDLFDYHKKLLNQSTSAIWSTFPSVEIKNYVLLKDIAYVGVGMVSGFDKAFRIPTNKNHVIYDYPNIVLPFIKAEHCKGYWTEGKSYYIMLDEEVTNETELKRKYPEIYEYLLPFREKMQKRYLPSNKKWFQWQALRNFKDFKEMSMYYKIFVPTLDRSLENRFSITKELVYPSGDVLAIIPTKVNPFFVLGYLNSSFFRNYYYSEGARRGHRIAYTQRILSNAKIPLFSPEVQKKVTVLTKKIVTEKNKSYREKIDEIIDSAIKEEQYSNDKKTIKRTILDFLE